jgi:tRNA A-37 threonylcarbamoyl transferase component Bud32
MSDRLDSLLLAWQEWHAQGHPVTPAEVCRDCPELAGELSKRIEALQQMNALMQGSVRLPANSPEGTLLSGQATRQTGSTSGTLRSLGENRNVAALTVGALPGYDILGELGRGGMGVVYKARQHTLNRTVALKMILAGSHAGPAAMARFLKEAELIARLKHPNVVQVYEYGSHAGMAYFSLEYLEGGSLAARIDGEPQPPVEAARTVRTLARAVHAAHDNGIVHRDLKPGNVLLAADGTPKISDFGLAKQGDSAMTATGEVMGTPSYMAPEQAAGKAREVGPAADVYALGAILYDLLTGRPPFKGASVWDTIQMVTDAEPVPPSRLQPKVPRDLEVVCLKCLQKEPGKRYGSAAALADDLDRFLEGEPIVARPVSRPERLWRWCQRKPLVATLMAALVLVVSGSLVGLTALWLDAEDKRVAAVEAQGLAQQMAAEANHQRNVADEQSRRARVQADNARREADKAQRTAQVLIGMFQAADPLGLSGIPALRSRGGEKLTALEILKGAPRLSSATSARSRTHRRSSSTVSETFFVRSASPARRDRFWKKRWSSIASCRRTIPTWRPPCTTLAGCTIRPAITRRRSDFTVTPSPSAGSMSDLIPCRCPRRWSILAGCLPICGNMRRRSRCSRKPSRCVWPISGRTIVIPRSLAPAWLLSTSISANFPRPTWPINRPRARCARSREAKRWRSRSTCSRRGCWDARRPASCDHCSA